MQNYDEKFVNEVVDRLKKQGLFDQFRKECLSDIDTKPAYQNLQTRVQGAVDRFLLTQTWRPQLKKNVLRESLRKHLNELPMLSIGIDRVVDQVINQKFISNITPLIDKVTCEYLGINYEEWKTNKEDQDRKIADAKIPSLLDIDTSIPQFNCRTNLSTSSYPTSNQFNSLNSQHHPQFINPSHHYLDQTSSNSNHTLYNQYGAFNTQNFDENSYEASYFWKFGPVHPHFGVPLPTMPYVPEPAPPLPEEEPEAPELPEHPGSSKSDELMQVEEQEEIDAEETEVVDNGQDKSYHFEWDNCDDNAVSDVSVSSVHTSDLSSFENDERDEGSDVEQIDKLTNVSIDSESNKIVLDESIEESSPKTIKTDLVSSGKKAQLRSKAEMKEERRERKMTEKKRMLWEKMNSSFQEQLHNDNILIEEEFATVEEEIVVNEVENDYKNEKFVTIDVVSNNDQDHDNVGSIQIKPSDLATVSGESCTSIVGESCEVEVAGQEDKDEDEQVDLEQYDVIDDLDEDSNDDHDSNDSRNSNEDELADNDEKFEKNVSTNSSPRNKLIELRRSSSVDSNINLEELARHKKTHLIEDNESKSHNKDKSDNVCTSKSTNDEKYYKSRKDSVESPHRSFKTLDSKTSQRDHHRHKHIKRDYDKPEHRLGKSKHKKSSKYNSESRQYYRDYSDSRTTKYSREKHDSQKRSSRDSPSHLTRAIRKKSEHEEAPIAKRLRR